MRISFEDHPLLEAATFTAELPRALEELPSPDWLRDLLRLDAEAPLRSSDDVRAKVRDLLRHGGYKPTGRGKPASEYLIKAATEGTLSPINAVVDACNIASLHSGLPISVVDLGRTREPFSVRLARAGEGYIFNTSGQTIDLEGLLCLCDAEGPCANAVRDSQRTKTQGGTTRVLAIVWGTKALPGLAATAARWYRDLMETMDARTQESPREGS